MAVASSENRTKFAGAVQGIVEKYGVDGVEFEYVPPPFLKRLGVSWSFHDYSWESPNNQPSGGCNTVSADDSANFLDFLQTMRQTLGTNKTISAAVGLTTWNDANGSPLTNVSAYADVLDYICGLYSPFFNVVLTNSRLRQF